MKYETSAPPFHDLDSPHIRVGILHGGAAVPYGPAEVCGRGYEDRLGCSTIRKYPFDDLAVPQVGALSFKGCGGAIGAWGQSVEEVTKRVYRVRLYNGTRVATWVAHT